LPTRDWKNHGHTSSHMSSLRYFALCLACATAACGSEPSFAPAPGEPLDAAPRRELARPSIPREAGSASQGGASTSQAGAEEEEEGGAAPSAGEGAGCEPSRVVLEADVSNARDLGGVALAPSGQVQCGAFFRGPPLSLSEQGCQQFRELGVRTIVDLRIEGEQLSRPDATCGVAELVSAPLPIPYGLGAEDYLRDLHATDSIAVAFHAFGDASRYPLYFHCTYGRDRTGVVGALLLLTLGASREAVMDEYLLSKPNVGAYPESLSAVLDEIELRGGPERVLTDAGISADEIAVIREHVVLD
jgi:protein-tyrosine phosphatase